MLVHFTIALQLFVYVNMEFYVHVFLHLYSGKIFAILLVRDIGADNTSQNLSPTSPLTLSRPQDLSGII